MYNDLADAIEDLKEKGIDNLFEGDDDMFVERYLSNVHEMSILSSYVFDSGTDPGDESTLFIVETPDKEKKYIVMSYGAHVNPKKQKLISSLMKLKKNDQ